MGEVKRLGAGISRRRIVLALTALGLLFVPCLSAVELTLVPEAVALNPGETRRVLAVVRNTSEATITSLRLDPISPPGTTLETPDLTGAVLPAGASRSWIVDVTRDGLDSPAGPILFRLRFSRSKDGSTSEGVVVRAFETLDRPGKRVEDVVSVRTESSIEVLQEKRPGEIFLIVESKADVPVTITGVQVRAPDFIVLEQLDPMDASALPPSGKRILAFAAETSDRVRPGRNLVLFEVRVEWRDAAGLSTGSVLAKQSFGVSVLGESPPHERGGGRCRAPRGGSSSPGGAWLIRWT